MRYSGGKPIVQFYPHQATVDWEDRVADMAQLQLRGLEVQGDGRDFTLPLDGRVLLTIRYNLAKPASYPKRIVYPTKKPDLDNLNKALVDGLVKGRIIVDDAKVTDQTELKRYAGPGHPEGVEVDLTVVPVES